MSGDERIRVKDARLAKSVPEFVASANHLVNLRNTSREPSPVIAELLARGATDLRPAVEDGEIRRHLDSLRTWHNDATLKLHELVATHSTLDSRGELTDETTRTLSRSGHRLITSLGRNAVSMALLESSRGRWHVSKGWASEAIRLRREVAHAVVGRELRADIGAHLELAYSTFMLEGNSPALRAGLRDAVTGNPKSAPLAYWSARYELIAGNHGEALRTVIAGAKGGRLAELLPILSPQTKAPPWVPYPCNFYTYRHSFVSDDQLRNMQQELATKASSADAATRDKAALGMQALDALLLWSQANRDMEHEKYAAASRNYRACQRSVLAYFAKRFPDRYTVPEGDPGVYAVLVRLARDLIKYAVGTRPVWCYFRKRYGAITLEELHELDWIRPGVAPDLYKVYHSSDNLLRAMLELPAKVDEKINAPLLALALIFAPLGYAEANRLRRNFDETLRVCRELLRRHADFKILCEFIEKPFIKILSAQTLLEKGDAEYKARLIANSPALNADGTPRYQGLAAAETYAGVALAFQDQGNYVSRVESGLSTLQTRTRTLLQKSMHPLVQTEPALGLSLMTAVERFEVSALGKPVPIDTVVSRQAGFPGLERTVGPHESIIRFEPPAGETALRESNPLVYAILAQARARLMQLEAGLNFLGYSDDYVPPWRFQFLLTRARYYAEHAKNAEREYLNFLQNAEREEFQELSVAQNVVLEKSNIRIENARVDQARLQLEAAKQSAELARLTAANAGRRLSRYAEFDQRADSLSEDVIGDAGLSMAGAAGSGALSGAVAGAIVGSVIPGIGTAIGAIGGAIIGGLSGLFSSAGSDKSAGSQLAVADEQRAYERFSLELARTEAAASATVADAHTAVAQSVVIVSAMQRAAALLRHEFAVQSLTFLRNRALGSELWYRLAHLIRGVSDTYLRYAIELAFLAEQAYEFEVDKRVNVIRFDYDVSELGSMLAADFLLADLDTLEQDLIVSERTRQQPMRFIVSLAREYPSALSELQETGSTIITIPLESVERRIPGFYNIRVGSLEVVPLALMDRTRFGVEVTHLGTSQVRLRALSDGPSGAPPLDPRNVADVASWLPGADGDWPVNVRVYGPETALFSGITANTIATDPAFAFTAQAQRGAFEHRGVAGSWRIDMSMVENKIVAGSLTDFLVAFNLHGYHDPVLRDAVDKAPRRTRVSTRWLSARTGFADAFYRFQQTGRMEWDLRDRRLGFEVGGTLRNFGIMLIPETRRPAVGRLLTSHVLEVTVRTDGTLTVAHDIPDLTIVQTGLHVAVTASTSAGATIRWSFDDGTNWIAGTSATHDYRRPGSYDIIVRVERAQRLFEHSIAIAVSDTTDLSTPLVVRPSVQIGAGDGSPIAAGLSRVVATAHGAAPDVAIIWKLPHQHAVAGSRSQMDLPPGSYALAMTAVRKLDGRVYGRQRYVPDQPVVFGGLRTVTNRQFDANGTDVTATRNALTNHLFTNPLSPSDIWTLDLPLASNGALRTISRSGAEEIVLREIQDAILILEYES